MGFFDRFISTGTRKEEPTNLHWHNLNGIDQLDVLIEESKAKLIGIFKHSTRCGVSRGVLKSFEKEYHFSEDQIKLYFLDLLANRELSNAIENKFNVQHESPQLILIKNGKAVNHASHNSIEASQIEQYIF